MLAITILLLAAAPATHHARTAHPARIVHHGRVARKARRPTSLTSRKLQVITAYAKPRSPYRLPLDLAPEPSAKDIALNEDGMRCALIGQTICPRRTRTIIRMGEDSPVKVPREAPH
jgi:hypothetical protein